MSRNFGTGRGWGRRGGGPSRGGFGAGRETSSGGRNDGRQHAPRSSSSKDNIGNGRGWGRRGGGPKGGFGGGRGGGGGRASSSGDRNSGYNRGGGGGGGRGGRGQGGGHGHGEGGHDRHGNDRAVATFAPEKKKKRPSTSTASSRIPAASSSGYAASTTASAADSSTAAMAPDTSTATVDTPTATMSLPISKQVKNLVNDEREKKGEALLDTGEAIVYAASEYTQVQVEILPAQPVELVGCRALICYGPRAGEVLVIERVKSGDHFKQNQVQCQGGDYFYFFPDFYVLRDAKGREAEAQCRGDRETLDPRYRHGDHTFHNNRLKMFKRHLKFLDDTLASISKIEVDGSYIKRTNVVMKYKSGAGYLQDKPPSGVINLGQMSDYEKATMRPAAERWMAHEFAGWSDRFLASNERRPTTAELDFRLVEAGVSTMKFILFTFIILMLSLYLCNLFTLGV